jgi:hypothetical protein
MASGDFSSMYKESAPRFKKVGSEAEFVSLMLDFRRRHGHLESANEVAYEIGIEATAGKVYVLTFELEFEQARTRERLTLVRSQSQGVLLWIEIEPPTK